MPFAKEALEEEQALFVKDNLIHFANPQGKNEQGKKMNKERHWIPYSPDANTLYVSPSYLDKENVTVNDETRQKLAHLQKVSLDSYYQNLFLLTEAELKKAFEESWMIMENQEEASAPLEYEMRAIVSEAAF